MDRVVLNEQVYIHMGDYHRLKVACEMLRDIVPNDGGPGTGQIPRGEFYEVYRKLVEWRDAHLEAVDTVEGPDGP